MLMDGRGWGGIWLFVGGYVLLQCSCLENPRDGGASRADVYGVTQSQTRLKQLSSSSSSSTVFTFHIPLLKI